MLSIEEIARRGEFWFLESPELSLEDLASPSYRTHIAGLNVRNAGLQLREIKFHTYICLVPTGGDGPFVSVMHNIRTGDWRIEHQRVRTILTQLYVPAVKIAWQRRCAEELLPGIDRSSHMFAACAASQSRNLPVAVIGFGIPPRMAPTTTYMVTHTLAPLEKIATEFRLAAKRIDFD